MARRGYPRPRSSKAGLVGILWWGLAVAREVRAVRESNARARKQNPFAPTRPARRKTAPYWPSPNRPDPADVAWARSRKRSPPSTPAPPVGMYRRPADFDPDAVDEAEVIDPNDPAYLHEGVIEDADGEAGDVDSPVDVPSVEVLAIENPHSIDSGWSRAGWNG